MYYVLLQTFLLLTNRSAGWPRQIMPCMPLYIMYASHHIVAKDKAKKNSRINPPSLRRFLVFTLIFSLVLFAFSVKMGFYAITPHVQAAKWLQEKVDISEEKVVCNALTVMILSDLPLETFVRYGPAEEADVSDFLNFLKKNNIGYVVSDYGRFEAYGQNLTIAFSSENGWIVIYEVG